MKTQYTPGPWRVDPEPFCDGGWYIQTADGQHCIAQTPPDLPVETEDEHLANAQLIAAAPMLAEALKACLTELEIIAEMYPQGPHRAAAVESARTALAAAGVVS